MREICNLYDINKTRTTPNHPQGDGLVERINRTLIDTIALVAKDAKDNWDLRIGLALMAIRSAVQSSTGFSPHFLMFGREMRLPADLVYEAVNEETRSQVESVAHLRSTLQMVHETVVSNMGCKQKHQKDYYDRRAHGVRYSKGDRVWLVNNKPNLFTNQFHDRWLWPYEVVARRFDLVYDIRDPTTAKVKRVHFNLLKIAANDINHNLNKNSKTPEVVELSFESEDEIVLLPPFAGDLNIEDNEINLPNNQALVRPNNAPPLRHDIVQQEGNAVPA